MESSDHSKNGAKPKSHTSRVKKLTYEKNNFKTSYHYGLGIHHEFLLHLHTYTLTVGDGPQTGVQVKKMNHYLIYGLAPLNVSDPQELAGDATDYEVKIEHTFIDGLINAITFGIYTPTTTIVTK